jgi:hypothetical protein
MSAGLDLARFECGQHPAAGFAAMRAVPKTTARLECGFESREMLRHLLG